MVEAGVVGVGRAVVVVVEGEVVVGTCTASQSSAVFCFRGYRCRWHSLSRSRRNSTRLLPCQRLR